MTYMFVEEDPKDLTSKLLDKYSKLSRFQAANNLTARWKKSYQAYYGDYYKNSSLGIGTAGEQGEFSTIAVNQFRNIIKYICAMVTQNRLVFDAMAANADVTSRNATVIANAVLDQYFYEKRFEQDCKQALELSMIFGTAFLHVGWEPNQNLVGLDSDDKPVYAGSPRMTAYSPLDVLIEPWKHSWKEQLWCVTREKVNKHDLAALHPELAEEILDLPRIADLQHFMPTWEIDDDNVYLYKAYHKPTPSLLTGRYTVFCDGGVVLQDEANPYEDLPLFCMRPDVRYGGAYGHTVAFDLLPIQQALNILDSSILTNQEAYAVQNVAVPKDAGVLSTLLSGGMRLHEYDIVDGAKDGGLPQAMNLCSTPPEVFNQRSTYVSDMEQLSGINSAVRGNPNSSLVSGTAIALVATQANTFNSAIESAYVNLCEEAAYFLLKIILKFMRTEELLTVAGRHNTYAVTSFQGDDLSPIKRVRINVGNPLARNLAGRLEIANNLLQNQMLRTPSEYIEVIQTGSLNPILESSTAQEAYIKIENDNLAKGIEAHTLATDNHQKHINEHLVLTYRPDVRANSDILALVLQHIEGHVHLLEELAATNPMMLSIALEQPLQLPPPSPESGFGEPPPGAPSGSQSAQPLPQAQKPEPPGDQTVEAAQTGGNEKVAQGALNRAENAMKKAESQPQANLVTQ